MKIIKILKEEKLENKFLNKVSYYVVMPGIYN